MRKVVALFLAVAFCVTILSNVSHAAQLCFDGPHGTSSTHEYVVSDNGDDAAVGDCSMDCETCQSHCHHYVAPPYLQKTALFPLQSDHLKPGQTEMLVSTLSYGLKRPPKA
ncbi:MAG: hypothetical protein AB7E85_04705 [Pseudobdellovibrionaceae bacterium]